jgi:hypothetical protein
MRNNIVYKVDELTLADWKYIKDSAEALGFSVSKKMGVHKYLIVNPNANKICFGSIPLAPSVFTAFNKKDFNQAICVSFLEKGKIYTWIYKNKMTKTNKIIGRYSHEETFKPFLYSGISMGEVFIEETTIGLFDVVGIREATNEEKIRLVKEEVKNEIYWGI